LGRIPFKTLSLFSILAFSGLFSAADPQKQTLVNTCVACHGTGGSSVGPASPSIGGLSQTYLLGAMLAFKYHDDPDELELVIAGDPDFADVEPFNRYSTIMTRIAKGYTDSQIKKIAHYFSVQEFVRPRQKYDRAKAKKGQRYHKAHCEKCHANGGRSPEGDSGVLAGQWMPYFKFTMHDYKTGAREMPKTMRKELEKLHAQIGDTALEDLKHYYASQR